MRGLGLAPRRLCIYVESRIRATPAAPSTYYVYVGRVVCGVRMRPRGVGRSLPCHDVNGHAAVCARE